VTKFQAKPGALKGRKAICVDGQAAAT
jgi:hypothetical protein